jgi:hypothetical protein
MTYGRYRPSSVTIPGPVFQRRAAALLRELGETPAGKVVVIVVRWVQLQLELERDAAGPRGRGPSDAPGIAADRQATAPGSAGPAAAHSGGLPPVNPRSNKS